MKTKTPKQKAAERAWREKKKAEGYCRNCFNVKAGGPGGTEAYCGPCAEKRREIYHREFYGPYRGETTKQVDEMLSLARKTPKSSVVVSELRRQSVC